MFKKVSITLQILQSKFYKFLCVSSYLSTYKYSIR